jgi:hypothetical protein
LLSIIANAKVILNNWAANHKTIIVLNGGTTENIQSIFQDLWLNANVQLPFDKFHEDENSLGGIITCCGIIVPEEMYEAELMLCGDYYYEKLGFGSQKYYKNTPAWHIITAIKSCHLAR